MKFQIYAFLCGYLDFAVVTHLNSSMIALNKFSPHKTRISRHGKHGGISKIARVMGLFRQTFSITASSILSSPCSFINILSLNIRDRLVYTVYFILLAIQSGYMCSPARLLIPQLKVLCCEDGRSLRLDV